MELEWLGQLISGLAVYVFKYTILYLIQHGIWGGRMVWSLVRKGKRGLRNGWKR